MLGDRLGIGRVEVVVCRDKARPQTQEVVEAVGCPLPRVECLAREVADERQPLLIAGVLDDVRELVVGLHPRQHPAELVVVVGVLQARAVLQDATHAGHQLSEVLLPIVHGRKEGAPHCRKKGNRLHHQHAVAGLQLGVETEEEIDDAAVLDLSAPRSGDLDGGQVLVGLVDGGANEVEAQAAVGQLQRLREQCSVRTVLRGHSGDLVEVLQHALEDVLEAVLAEKNGDLPVHRDGVRRVALVQLLNERIEDAQAQHAVLGRGREELGHVGRHRLLALVLHPAQLCDKAEELDNGVENEVRQVGAAVPQKAQQVVAELEGSVLVLGEGVPVGG
mmetsp:Transcript_18337/g.70841  ORF Transcript_18337/g.70841 Transcript_18337/m.70841 type:complete len:333 (-) Transcript_18337:255-1253(-)